ncbi:MAG TPA: AAA family ATPase [Dehalococcoidia bacterium]|nr:AAA family ATPase [Dehalococcoidia bacterium]
MVYEENIGEMIISEATRIQRITTTTENAGRIIMATGRGGTGKTTFVALLSRYIKSPLLLLDIDPDQSLAAMLGIDIDTVRKTTEAGRDVPIKTLSDLTHDIEDEDAFMELAGAPVTKKLPLLLQWYTQMHTDRFDLMSLGPKWTEGDYRTANNVFEFIIPSIGENYANILIDSPAGLEHLNRRIVPRINDLFIVVDPSKKSIAHIDRVRRITQKVGMTFERLFIVGNYEFDTEAEKIMESTGETYLGKMDYDAGLKKHNLLGKSLLDLPDDSPACQSIKRIIAGAGYEVG